MSAAESPKSTFSIGRVLMVVIPLAIVAWAAKIYSSNLEQIAQADLEKTMASRLLGAKHGAVTLASRYKDADGDLVADLPADAAEQIEPAEIRFSYVAASAPENEKETWKEFMAALEAAARRPVKLVSYADAEEQLRALRDGELHITWFSTGEAERAVNDAGFVPLACFADKDGKYRYTMKIIVPADSNIQEVADLKGRRITYVRPGSHSGCTAPVVMLMKNHGLQPERDYAWGFSYDHDNSIKGVAEKRFEAAAVASDLLERMIASGEVDGEAIREIFESSEFPPAVLGCAYNLKPELQDAIRETVVNFDWKGSGLEKVYGPQGSVKFAEVSYKDDWKSVRDTSADGRQMLAKIGAPATHSGG